MSIKHKILDALGCALDDLDDLDDLDEERLLEILLGAYSRKKQRIIDLERQHAAANKQLRDEQEYGRADRGRMVSGPQGEYFFELPKQGLEGRRFVVRAVGDRIDLCERLKGYDFMARQVSREDFLK